MHPQEFLAAGRKELARYDTVALRTVQVTDAACRPDNRYEVVLATGETFVSRKLLHRDRRPRQPAGDRRLRRALRTQRVPLPVLRRMGSARSTARDLRPRRSRPRPVARAHRLEPRSRALHRWPVRDRSRRARPPGAQRHQRPRGAPSSGSKAPTAAFNTSSSPMASGWRATRCSSPPGSRSDRISRSVWAATSTRREPSAPASTRQPTCRDSTSRATRRGRSSGSSSPPPKAPRRRSRSTPT